MRDCKNTTIEIETCTKLKGTDKYITIKINRHDLILLDGLFVGVVYTKGIPYVYIRETLLDGSTSRMTLSRYILDLKKKDRSLFAVHINGDRFDFRRCNLSTITSGERRLTSQDKRIRKEKLPRGVYSGPILKDGTVHYRARLVTKDQETHLGIFSTPEEASEVYRFHHKSYLESLRTNHSNT